MGSPDATGPGVPSGGIRANSLISRRVMLGASRASPAATTRIAVIRSAGRVSLSRKPLAPARSAPNTYSSRSKVVRMITRAPADSGAAVIWRVASMPSSTGIRTSISTTSGWAARATATASAPLAASPTTVSPSVAAMIPQNPTRTSAWSSATATEIVTPRPTLRSGSTLPAAGGGRAAAGRDPVMRLPRPGAWRAAAGWR